MRSTKSKSPPGLGLPPLLLTVLCALFAPAAALRFTEVQAMTSANSRFGTTMSGPWHVAMSGNGSVALAAMSGKTDGAWRTAHTTASRKKGDVFISRDGGSSWANANILTYDGRSNSALSHDWAAVAVSHNGLVLVAAARPERVTSYYKYGSIWISKDSGSSWTETKTAQSTSATGVPWWSVVSVGDNGVIAAADYMNQYYTYTTNYGGSWKKRRPYPYPAAPQWTQLKLSGDGNRLVAAFGGAYGGGPGDASPDKQYGEVGGLMYGLTTIYGSSKKTTPEHASGLVSSHKYRTWTGLCSNYNGSMWLAAHASYGTSYDGMIYKSIDSGATWASITSANTSLKSGNFTGLACDDELTEVIVLRGKDGISRSTDGGASFSSSCCASQADWSQVAMATSLGTSSTRTLAVSSSISANVWVDDGSTASPTTSPTGAPSNSPTAAPSKSPTAPTATPTVSPSASPTTLSPTSNPSSAAPTESPSSASPSTTPTTAPSASPTTAPTTSPSGSPTTSPTVRCNSPAGKARVDACRSTCSECAKCPTMAPTKSPTKAPTYQVYALMPKNESCPSGMAVVGVLGDVPHPGGVVTHYDPGITANDGAAQCEKVARVLNAGYVNATFTKWPKGLSYQPYGRRYGWVEQKGLSNATSDFETAKASCERTGQDCAGIWSLRNPSANPQCSASTAMYSRKKMYATPVQGDSRYKETCWWQKSSYLLSPQYANRRGNEYRPGCYLDPNTDRVTFAAYTTKGYRGGQPYILNHQAICQRSCPCPHGTGSLATACPNPNGGPKSCAACDPGYVASADRSKCVPGFNTLTTWSGSASLSSCSPCSNFPHMDDVTKLWSAECAKCSVGELLKGQLSFAGTCAPPADARAQHFLTKEKDNLVGKCKELCMKSPECTSFATLALDPGLVRQVTGKTGSKPDCRIYYTNPTMPPVDPLQRSNATNATINEGWTCFVRDGVKVASARAPCVDDDSCQALYLNSSSVIKAACQSVDTKKRCCMLCAPDDVCFPARTSSRAHINTTNSIYQTIDGTEQKINGYMLAAPGKSCSEYGSAVVIAKSADCRALFGNGYETELAASNSVGMPNYLDGYTYGADPFNLPDKCFTRMDKTKEGQASFGYNDFGKNGNSLGSQYPLGGRDANSSSRDFTYLPSLKSNVNTFQVRVLRAEKCCASGATSSTSTFRHCKCTVKSNNAEQCMEWCAKTPGCTGAWYARNAMPSSESGYNQQTPWLCYYSVQKDETCSAAPRVAAQTSGRAAYDPCTLVDGTAGPLATPKNECSKSTSCTTCYEGFAGSHSSSAVQSSRSKGTYSGCYAKTSNKYNNFEPLMKQAGSMLTPLPSRLYTREVCACVAPQNKAAGRRSLSAAAAAPNRAEAAPRPSWARKLKAVNCKNLACRKDCSDCSAEYKHCLIDPPTMAPTNVGETHAPTSAFPTATPTAKPTASPSAVPTSSPTSASPTASPTVGPTASPTTDVPTSSPSMSPTKPTASPTRSPTKVGETYAPSTSPTASPTTGKPSMSPTKSPTNEPTEAPTNSPTAKPTAAPTNAPTNAPTTGTPTSAPSTRAPTTSACTLLGADIHARCIACTSSKPLQCARVAKCQIGWEDKDGAASNGCEAKKAKRPIIKTVFKGGVSASAYASGMSKKLGKTIKPEDVSVKQTIKQKMNFPDSIPPTKIKTSVAKVLGVAESNVLVTAASSRRMRRSLRASTAYDVAVTSDADVSKAVVPSTLVASLAKDLSVSPSALSVEAPDVQTEVSLRVEDSSVSLKDVTDKNFVRDALATQGVTATVSSSAEAVEAAAPAPGQAVKDEDDGVLLIIIVVGVVVLVLSAVAIYFCTRKSEEKVAAYDPNSTHGP